MIMEKLDLNQLPLSGIRLIEASAGTGKTYTIASLYLRLLLERGLSVKQILVVTFTNAATEELRDRIRKRMREALQQLQGCDEQADPTLQQILDGIADKKIAVQTLKDAITLMDEAAVFTIHGFCQRMLSENAFESGSLFDADFITDEGDYLRAIAEDFWRSHFYQLPTDDAEWVANNWKSPLTLLGDVRRYLNRHELKIIPQVDEEKLNTLLTRRQQLITEVQQQWLKQGEQITELLKTYNGFNGNKYRKASLQQALDGMDVFSRQNNPLNLPPRIDLLTTSKLATVMKKGFEPPQHLFFGACDQLNSEWAEPEQLRRFLILQQFIDYSRHTLTERKALHNVISTDDLLMHLRDALTGSSAETLAAHIAKQYPVAMIDEFQDTDPVQYAIFSAIYHQQSESALYMIGDPKQAIYSFRGADIFTYMQARHDTQQHYTLDTNWRSSSRLINAINQLFQASEKPFIYNDDIQFQAVNASPSADEKPLLINGEPVVPLQVWQVKREPEEKKPLSKAAAKSLLAQSTAQQIAKLLNQGFSGKATIGGKTLQPHNIAVLVRSHSEAAAVQQALRDYHVASAYISRDSIFDSREAAAVARLLLAVLEPSNERRLRACLCDELMGLSAQQLFDNLEDENCWETLLQQFQNYHNQWRDHGFMSMFQALLHQQQVPQKLLSTEQGERALSNVLQLAELLQAASKVQHGMDGLSHWYHEQLQAKTESEERQLRLESDEALVQIVTIHKSKGLEYSVVFLPFIYGSMPTRNKEPLLFHDDQLNLTLDLGSKQYADHYTLADKERLAEELRLLYVALTRAKHLCYLAWGKINGAATSALAYLLHGNEMADLADSELWQRWSDLAGQQPNTITLTPLPEANNQVYLGSESGGELLQARHFNGQIERSWQVSSFSALTRSHGHSGLAMDYDAQQIITRSTRNAEDIFSFPKGATAGTMMHALFENIDFTQQHGPSIEEITTEQLAKYGFDERWQSVISQMVSDVLATTLDEETGLTLQQITEKQRLVEMEFHYPIGNVNAVQLNKLMSGLANYPGEGSALNFAPQQGIMTGFIDLVFEYQGKYYIADYKSNHLGNQVGDYEQAALAAAMQGHRYDLQYLIYTVALHRYLQVRVKDYCYEEHFGGVYYLFLRGMLPKVGDGSGVFFDMPEFELIEALDGLFGG